MRLTPLSVALVLVAGAPAFAASAPAPKPDFTSFAFMKGTWSCRIAKDPDPKMIGKIYPFAVAADPGGYWFVATTPRTKRYLTRDSETSKWVSTALTSDGHSYSDSASGWSGDAIVFKDEFASDGSPLGSTTITKRDAHRFTIHSVQPTAKGAEIDDETCTKP